MPTSLTVELTAAAVGTPVSAQHRTAVELTLCGSTGRIRVSGREGDARSVHTFRVADASDVGVGPPYGLPREEAARVLAISCSLANCPVLFSSLQPARTRPPELLTDPETSIVYTAEASDTATAHHLAVADEIRIGLNERVELLITFPVALDEAEVLDVAARLLAFRPFERSSRTPWEGNVLDAVDAYARAAEAAEPVTCFQSLYNTLEKAVNAYRTGSAGEPTGCAFDAAARCLTGVPQTSLKKARELSNRLKHVRRSPADSATLMASLADIAPVVLDTKRAADAAILARL